MGARALMDLGLWKSGRGRSQMKGKTGLESLMIMKIGRAMRIRGWTCTIIFGVIGNGHRQDCSKYQFELNA
jgi:hypothetical protein